MTWIKYPFILFWQILKVLSFSFFGIYSKVKRKQAIKIISSWNKFTFAILFFLFTLSYFYIIIYLIEKIKPYMKV